MIAVDFRMVLIRFLPMVHEAIIRLSIFLGIFRRIDYLLIDIFYVKGVIFLERFSGELRAGRIISFTYFDARFSQFVLFAVI